MLSQWRRVGRRGNNFPIVLALNPSLIITDVCLRKPALRQFLWGQGWDPFWSWLCRGCLERPINPGTEQHHSIFSPFFSSPPLNAAFQSATLFKSYKLHIVLEWKLHFFSFGAACRSNNHAACFILWQVFIHLILWRCAKVMHGTKSASCVGFEEAQLINKPRGSCSRMFMRMWGRMN